MSPADLESFVAQAARLLDLDLSKDSAAHVAAQMAILLEHAEAFSSFDLPPETEPLTEFVP